MNNNASNSGRPVNTASGGTGQSSFPPNSILCTGTNPTDPLKGLDTSVAGQVLYTAGNGYPPYFAFPGAGLNFIAYGTTFDPFSITQPGTYLLVWNDFYPNTDGDDLTLVVSNDGGSNYASTGYMSGINYSLSGSATFTNIHGTTSILCSSPVQGVVYGTSGYIFLSNILTALPLMVSGQVNTWDNDNSTSTIGTIMARGPTGTTTVNAISLSFASGIAGGLATLFYVQP